MCHGQPKHYSVDHRCLIINTLDPKLQTLRTQIRSYIYNRVIFLPNIICSGAFSIICYMSRSRLHDIPTLVKRFRFYLISQILLRDLTIFTNRSPNFY